MDGIRDAPPSADLEHAARNIPPATFMRCRISHFSHHIGWESSIFLTASLWRLSLGCVRNRMIMFTQGLSREVGSRGITVNNVQPGPIDTDLNPASGDWAVPQKAATALDRYGHVDEIAAMVAFVAGPESSYITGANLTVDGGMNA
jgi:Enoyl-(Acyl carrier protein) reductase